MWPRETWYARTTRTRNVFITDSSSGCQDASTFPVRTKCHRTSCVATLLMSAASVLNVASYASGRVRMTSSYGNFSGNISRRANSRSLRFSRLRKTADRLKRATMTPTLIAGICTRGEVTIRTSINVVRMRFPSRAIRCRSALRVTRALRGKPKDAKGVLRSRILVRDANRQLLASLFPPTSERCTPPLRFHPCTKSVRLEPSSVAWTVRWLSHIYSRSSLFEDCGTDW